ncbi:MAG: proton-conducting transporter membrane subunit, partial [Paracoccus sp. (in: a-proteobacteria)]|nr:proton-conducting transporter membrane subunit [Paracoccus sp. (in: a-proteobacteria)]
KRVIAYSTCSQLGYMFVAAGVGVYSVAMFHLLTHAFFKAMLFLGAGSVIHAMHHEQDMRNYGGLRRKIPLTFWAMLIGTLAITGVGIPLTHIGFAGFLSKDAVIESAFVGNSFAFWMLVIAAGMTSFYSWRLMFMTFWGQPRGDHHAHDHAHESPPVMTVPLGVLAIGAIFSGMLWYQDFFGDRVNQFFHTPVAEAASHDAPEAGAEAEAATGAETAHATPGELRTDVPAPVGGAIYMHPDNHVMHDAHYVPAWVKVSPFIAMLLGLFMAFMMYIRHPEAPAKLAETQRPLYNFLLNKWYFDEIYDRVFVRPALWLGRVLWRQGDGRIIDGTINGVAMGLIPRLARFAGRLQSGYIFHYALAMVVGILGLLIWVMMRGSM